VTSHNDVVTSETQLLKSLDRRVDFAGDSDGVWRTANEGWDTNPDALAILGTLLLDGSCDFLVGFVIAQSALDPDDSDIGAGSASWWRQGDEFSSSSGCKRNGGK
jgi:hypothetical protein